MRNIRIEGTTCLWWSILLLILPLRWLMCAFTAAIFHEFCHYLAIRAVGGRLQEIRVCPTGAIIETTPLSPSQELVCALAGPLGELLLLLFARFIPLTAICALVQSVFNLIPIYPLDGGRALQCAISLLRPHKDPVPICRWVERAFIFLMIALSIPIIFRFPSGFCVLLPISMLLLRVYPRKRPCKTNYLALQ